MEAEVYTVPSEIVFKSYSATTGPQIRNLLVKNTTSLALHTVISYPFSPSFRVSTPADLRAELKPSPFHLVFELPPKSTSKVIVELKPPESSSSPAGVAQHLHDVLVVLAGGGRALRVPVRAVPSGAEPAAGSTPACWPHQKELDAHCNSFIEQMKAMYKALSAPLPPTAAVKSTAPAALEAASPAGSVTASVAASGVECELSGESGATGGERPPVVGMAGTLAGTAPKLSPGSISLTTTAAVAPPLLAVAAAATTAAAAAAAASRPAPELPPEGFSQPQDLYDNGADVVYDADGNAVRQPYVLHKTVKVQGRAAVAVPVEGGGAAAAVSVVSNGRAPAASALLSLPPGDPISRTSSTISLTTAAVVGPSSRPGSASAGKLAFALNGKLYDARGNPLDSTLELLSAVGGLTVVDCGDGGPTAAAAAAASPTPSSQQPQQASRGSGSGMAITSPRLLTTSQGVGSTSPTAAAVTGGSRGLSPGPGPGRVSLAPLKYGNIPITASLRPGSAASSVSTHLGRPPPPPPPYTGIGGPGAVTVTGPAAAASPSAAGPCGPSADEDPLRKAALAAALRELGIADLPAPSPQRTPSSGQVSSGADWSRQGSVAAIPVGAALPAYLQYGLPPNYRPSSGRRRPPSTTGSAAAYDRGGDEVMGDHDDADLEAKLVQQIESNVLKTSGPGPAPAPKRPMGRGSAASPGSYLPPRAGAASSGGLGASSAAAANAAAVAAGSRLGKAAAAAAVASGCGAAAARRPMVPSSDDDYPEESEFEMRLQRQIDSDVTSGGGLTPGRGGGGGGGASWRGAGGGGGGGGGHSTTAVPRLSGPAGTPSVPGAPGGIKRSSSSSSSSGTAMAATTAAGGPRRASADAGLPLEKITASTRGGSGSGARPQASGAGNGAAGSRSAAPKPAAAATGKKPGMAGAGTGSKSTAGKVGAGIPGAQRMKANWDALG